MCTNNNMINGHEFVDLGLGVLWATCNVGAQIPEEFGGYFAWGETKPKRIFNEQTCETYEKVDIEEISGTERDVARILWGAPWRMPTGEEMEELITCKNKWIEHDGVWGRDIIGLSGNRIFLPAAGWREWGLLKGFNEVGYYWCGSSLQGDAQRAAPMHFDKSFIHMGVGLNYLCLCELKSRYYGMSIRPVADI